MKLHPQIALIFADKNGLLKKLRSSVKSAD
jgi:hypothetical protein